MVSSAEKVTRGRNLQLASSLQRDMHGVAESKLEAQSGLKNTTTRSKEPLISSCQMSADVDKDGKGCECGRSRDVGDDDPHDSRPSFCPRDTGLCTLNRKPCLNTRMSFPSLFMAAAIDLCWDSLSRNFLAS